MTCLRRWQSCLLLGLLSERVLHISCEEGVCDATSDDACLDDLYRDDVQVGAGSKNICAQGRLSPEFFMLGAEKSGSTSVCEMLSESPGFVFSNEPVKRKRVDGKLRVKKEANVFSDPQKFKKVGLSIFPECTSSKRLVAVDCSPQYLYESGTAERVKEWYKDNSTALTFMVQLREPVKRLQSAFEFFLKFNKVKGVTFADCAKRAIDVPKKRLNPTEKWMENCDMNVNRTMYIGQIAPYLRLFNPSQLIVVPFQFTFREPTGDHPDVPAYIWQRLGVEFPKTPQKVLHETKNKHPALEDALENALHKILKRTLNDRTGARALASMFVAFSDKQAGPFLYGYDGSPTDADSIAKWMRKNW